MKRFTAIQFVDHFEGPFHIDMKIGHVAANIFASRIAKHLHFGIVGPLNDPVLSRPMQANSRGFNKSGQLIRISSKLGFDFFLICESAFGLGPQRMTMIMHAINDIRLFWGNDLRFLNQF